MRKGISILLFFVSLSTCLVGQTKTQVVDREGVSIVKGKLFAKVKEEFRSVFILNDLSGTPIVPLFDRFSITSIQKKFPKKFKPRGKTNESGYPLVDLSLIYLIEYSNDFDENVAAEMFYASGMFEYVNAQEVPGLLHVPNDPKVGAQYHLDVINAFDAWDISKGDSNIVIGITDTGIDTDHPDLVGRIKKNYNDPIDGLDNDNDGYIDNFIGWDTGSDDNDPEVYKHHGNQVTGMAVANSNNGADIAAIGYNCMVLPVKICNDNGYLVGAYSGIVYAADHGADVINCSWGGPGSYSQYNQDIINYAAINQNAVVVAAAGNSNATSYFYPASYSNVISVGGTNANDEKWTQSANEGTNYNDKVDVVAPAHNVVALWRGGGSGLIGRGTSFASPIVAGLAGLVISEYPNSSSQKIAAIIKATTDNIYTVPGNESFVGTLGTGRINAHKALLPVAAPFLSFFKSSTNDGNDQNLAPGDTVLLSLDIINQLGATNNVSVIIRSSDALTTVIDSTSTIATIGAGEVRSCVTEFKFVVSGSAGINSSAGFEVEITDGTDVWFDSFTVKVNKDYIDITTNNLDLSFNNYGRIGYTYTGAGLGVDYKGAGSMIKDMGVLMGLSSTNVLSYEDYELLTFTPATIASGSADFTAKGILEDAWAMNPIGVKIDQLAYAWSTAPNEDYIIYEYVVKNPTANSMDDVFIGVFGDWDIGNAQNNKAGFDSGKNLGYVYEDGGMYGGVQALRSNKVNYYAFDKSGADGINIGDGFNDAEEFESMSSGVTHTSAAGDVANIISHGPYTIPSGDSIVLAFAIVAGTDLNDLKNHAQSAENMYESMRGIKLNLNNIQNVSCNGVNDGAIDLGVNLSFAPYDVKWHHDSLAKTTKVDSLSSGNYNVSIKDKNGISKLMNFSILEPELLEADLITSQDVACFGDKDGEVDLLVTGGTGSYNFKWNDPTVPSIENPQLRAGNYSVTVSDLRGCSDTVEVVINEPNELTVQTVWLLDDTAITCDGEASLLANGGVAPYSYSWNNGAPQLDEDVYGLCDGDYLVVVEDANGCKVEHNVTIEAPEIIDLDTTSNNSGANSIQEIITSFKLYPNPANEYLLAAFESMVNEEMAITILDMNGRIVEKVWADQVDSDTYKVVINTTKYQNGNYFIRMNSKSGASSFKFEVIH